MAAPNLPGLKKKLHKLPSSGEFSSFINVCNLDQTPNDREEKKEKKEEKENIENENTSVKLLIRTAEQASFSSLLNKN